MSIKAQAARGIKWQALDIISRQIISMLVFAMLARMLNPADFGLAGLVGVYLSFAALFVDQGVATALVQRRDLEPEHLDAAFWFGAAYAVGLCLITIAGAGYVASFFNEPTLAPLLRVASVGLIINSTATIHTALLTRMMDFRRPVMRTLLANSAGGAVGVGMALRGDGAWALIGQQLTSALASTCFLWAACEWRPSLSFSRLHFRQLLGISTSVFASVVIWFFCSRFDQIVIGRYLGPSLLGEYVIGTKLCELVKNFVNQPIAAVSLPTLSRLQGDHSRMCRAIYKGMELNALVAFAAFVGLAAVAPVIIPLMFGVKWELAANICVFLSLYTLVISLQVFTYPALLASGGPGGYVLINVLYSLGAVTACLFGARYGVTVIAASMFLNSMVMIVPVVLFLKMRIGLDPFLYFRPCLMPAIASIIMASCVWGVRTVMGQDHLLLVNLGCLTMIGAGAYIGSIAVLSPSSIRSLKDMLEHSLGIRRGGATVLSKTTETSSNERFL